MTGDGSERPEKSSEEDPAVKFALAISLLRSKHLLPNPNPNPSDSDALRWKRKVISFISFKILLLLHFVLSLESSGKFKTHFFFFLLLFPSFFAISKYRSLILLHWMEILG